MIKIATAECFTHGRIGGEIHKFIQNYKGNLASKYFKDVYEDKNLDELRRNLILVSSLFLPSVDGLSRILNVNPPEPHDIINGVKIYEEEEDKFVAVLMANGVRELLDVNIGIGTTAGIGKGGIAISNDKLDIITTTDVYADLRTLSSVGLSDCELIFKRQEHGIIKALKIFFYLLDDDLDKVGEFEGIEIVEK